MIYSGIATVRGFLFRSSFVVLFIFMLGWFFSTVTSASNAIPTDLDFNGYAWSSTIGWISLNCKTGGPAGSDICSTSNYKVTLNKKDGTITGFAWSSNIGWIKFGGLSNFKSGAGTIGKNATAVGVYPNLTITGWARACAGTSGGDCSSMIDNSTAGGWDGWIALNGTGYGVTTDVNGLDSRSYAWGSTVVGWIDFHSYVSLTLPGASLTATPCTVLVGQSTCIGHLTWTTTGLTTPNIYNMTNNTQISTAPANDNYRVTVPVGITNYVVRDVTTEIGLPVSLVASCPAGSNLSNGVCQAAIGEKPALAIIIDSKFVRSGTKVGVTFSINPDPLTDGQCTIKGPGISEMGIVNTVVTKTNPIMNYSQLKISCTGSYGTVEATNAIEVIPTNQEI